MRQSQKQRGAMQYQPEDLKYVACVYSIVVAVLLLYAGVPNNTVESANEQL